MAANFEETGFPTARYSMLCCCLCFLLAVLGLSRFRPESTYPAPFQALCSAHALHRHLSQSFTIMSQRSSSPHTFQGILELGAGMPSLPLFVLSLKSGTDTQDFRSNTISQSLRPPN